MVATPYQEMNDISNLCQLGWDDWVYYREHNALFSNYKDRLGRRLSPARGKLHELGQWILTSNATVVPSRTARPLAKAELHSFKEKRIRAIFDAFIEKRC